MLDYLHVRPAVWYRHKLETDQDLIDAWENGRDFECQKTGQYLSNRDINHLRKEMYIGVVIMNDNSCKLNFINFSPSEES